ncbi:MAG: PAS domain S-box protein [Thermodesulfobacteriota bacterium]|nr:PAS domain S-box protein [Thermodesulfobacteriota bacterium]
MKFTIDRSSDAAFSMEPDAHFIYVNDEACRSLGYSNEEILTMMVHDIDPIFPKKSGLSISQTLKKEVL